jgi:hypothetical protein
MTFGQIKSILEKNLLESYSNPTNFKKSLKEFKHNVLNNKSFSKLYSLYDDLSTPKGLNESDAKEYLEEGLSLIRSILENTQLPKKGEISENNYKDLDNLVYLNNINISERISSKKNILSVLTSNPTLNETTISIPLKSMVSIANQTIQNYLGGLDENVKKEVFHVLASKGEDLETEYTNLKESTINSLKTIMESQEDSEVKNKLTETIDKITSEKFDQVNFVRLKHLSDSIQHQS